MADLEKLKQNLQKNGFEVTHFATAAQAADYLDGQIDGKTVGVGGSITVLEMGLAERLRTHNTLHWHWTGDGDQAAAATCQVYLSSVNGAAETGELINIDGNGNRVASSLYGHKKVWFIVGRNKLAPTYEAAVYRARNEAAPQRARQLGKKTPCAVKADRCSDCRSPERVCRALVTLWGPMLGMETEVLLVDEDLGL